MAMFGKSAGLDPDNLSRADKAALFGAMLRDVGAGLNGGEVGAIARARDTLAARQQAALQRQMAAEAAGLFSPVAMPAPIMNDEGEDISAAFGSAGSPQARAPLAPRDMASKLAQMAAMGLDIGPYAKLAEFAQPKVQFERGYGYDEKTGAMTGAFLPNLGDGMMPTPEGVRAAPGYVDTLAEIEGARTKAQEGGKAAFDVISIDLPDGSKQQIPRDVAVQAILKTLVPGAASPGGGAAVGALGGGFGRSQTPAQAAAAKVEAEAAATARTTLPTDVATVDAAVFSIDNLLNDPALPKRTGMMGMLPAIPGSEGAGFDAQLKQLTGQVFLDAYASLRGAGAITVDEGKAATAAKARLDKAQNEQDFRAALMDLRGALSAGRQRMMQKAQGGQPGTARPRGNLSSIPLADRLAEARRRGLIQ